MIKLKSIWKECKYRAVSTYIQETCAFFDCPVIYSSGNIYIVIYFFHRIRTFCQRNINIIPFSDDSRQEVPHYYESSMKIPPLLRIFELVYRSRTLLSNSSVKCQHKNISVWLGLKSWGSRRWLRIDINIIPTTRRIRCHWPPSRRRRKKTWLSWWWE